MNTETFAGRILAALARSSPVFWPRAACGDGGGRLGNLAGLVAALRRGDPAPPPRRAGPLRARSDAARQQARSREAMRGLVQRGQQETIGLLRRLDLLAVELFSYAEAWDKVDPAVAASVWRQTRLLHAIRACAVTLAEEEAADMSAIVAEVNAILHQIREQESRDGQSLSTVRQSVDGR